MGGSHAETPAGCGELPEPEAARLPEASRAAGARAGGLRSFDPKSAVTHEVVFRLAGIDHLCRPPLGRERGFELLGPEAGRPVAVFEHDGRSGRVVRGLAGLRRRPSVRADFGSDLVADKPAQPAHPVSRDA